MLVCITDLFIASHTHQHSSYYYHVLLLIIGSDYLYQASSRSESENISNSDCLFYTPNPGACGTDTFGFRVRSTDGSFDQSATVTVNVFCEGVEPPSTSATQVPPNDSPGTGFITWIREDRTNRDPITPVVTTTAPPPPNDQELPDLEGPIVYPWPWWSGKSSKMNDDREACSKITSETSCGTEPKCEWTQYMEGGFMCVPLGATRYGSKSAKYSKAIKASKGGGGAKSSKHMKDFTTCGDIMSPKSCSYSKTYHKCYWNTVSDSCDDIDNVVCSDVYYKKDCYEMTKKGICYWNGVKDMCEDPPAPTPPVPTPPIPPAPPTPTPLSCSDSKDCPSNVCLVSQTDQYCIPSLVDPRIWDCSSANKCPDGSQTLAPCTINGGGSGFCGTIQVEFCSSNTRPSSGACFTPSIGFGSGSVSGFFGKTHIREVDVIKEPESTQVPESAGYVMTGKIVSMISIASCILWSIV